MKNFLLHILFGMFVVTSANAERLPWNLERKKLTYSALGIGILVAVGGNYAKSIHIDKAGPSILGISLISLAGLIFYIERVHPVETNKNLLVEHRDLIRFLNSKNAATDGMTNSNFEELLATFQCESCRDDVVKSRILKELVLKANTLGKKIYSSAALVGGGWSQAQEEQVHDELVRALGSVWTLENEVLIKYVVGQAYLSAVVLSSAPPR